MSARCRLTWFCAQTAGLLLLLTLWMLGGEPVRASEDVWALLKQPGHIVLLRHANAPGLGEEPPGIDLKNCAIQRNLDDAGRAQARGVGEAFRKHGIRGVHLLSSQFCRALETARLTGLGPVEPAPVLNYFNFSDMDRLFDGAAKTEAFMKRLPARQLTVLVTHISNIKAVTSVTPSSAEMVVVHFNAAGKLVVDGSIAAPN